VIWSAGFFYRIEARAQAVPRTASVPFKADAAVEFKSVDGLRLHLFLYHPKQAVPGAKSPCFVYFHGGGWTGGTPAQGLDLLNKARAQGMVAVNVEYRLADPKNPDPASCIEDAKSAIRFLRTHAERLGIDPNRICASGHSAGGHLAAACALLPKFDSTSDNLQFSCKPDALALIVPVLDNGPDKGYRFEVAAIRADVRAYSPAHNVVKGAPPTLICAGKQDLGAHLTCLQRFTDDMKRNDNRCELAVYEGGHGFANSGPAKEQVQDRIIHFIRSLGWFPQQPTTAVAPSSTP
jgi:acetyl esterase/lipase